MLYNKVVLMIIGLAGKKGSGKDTLGTYIIEKYHFQRIAFGDPVKEICKILFGFTQNQLHGRGKEDITQYGLKPREAFQCIGTDFGRELIHDIFIDNKSILNIERGNLWIEIFNRECEKKTGNVVITDVRFRNEADAIRKKGGIIILINSDFCNSIDNHKSEEVDITPDYIIRNNSSKEELYKKIDTIINELDSIL